MPRFARFARRQALVARSEDSAEEAAVVGGVARVVAPIHGGLIHSYGLRIPRADECVVRIISVKFSGGARSEARAERSSEVSLNRQDQGGVVRL